MSGEHDNPDFDPEFDEEDTLDLDDFTFDQQDDKDDDAIRPIETGGSPAPAAGHLSDMSPALSLDPFAEDDDENEEGDFFAPEPPAHLVGHNFDDSINFIEHGETLNLSKKDPTMTDLLIGVGWDQKAMEEKKLDMDVCCFLLNRNDVTREDDDFIFYNNPTGCNGAIKHLEDNRTGAGDGDDENMTLSLRDIPFDVLKIVFTLSCYDPEFEGFNMSMARNVYIRFVNNADKHEIVRYQLDETLIGEQNCMIAATLERDGPEWVLEATGATTDGDLGDLAETYGLMIAEKAG